MVIRISRSGLASAFINIVLALLMLLASKTENWMFLMSVLIVCSFVINIVMLKLGGLKLMSLSAIFIIMSYVFYFGQVVLNAFFPDYQFSSVIGNFAKNNNSVKEATLISYITIQSVEMWIILLHDRNKEIEPSTLEAVPCNLKSIKTIAWIFIIAFLPINLYLNLRAIAISRYSTYSRALASLTDNGGFLLLFSIFLVIGFALLLFAYPKRKRIVFLIEIAYLLLMTLSGSRIYSMISIIIIILCYVNSSEDFSFKRLAFVAVIGYFLLNIVNTISRMRLLEELSVSSVITQSFSNNNNVILQILEEFGGSIQSVILPIEQVPGVVPFGYGTTYLKGVVTVIPNFGGIITELSKGASYLDNLYNTSTMGGSYIGELYYNFGLIGLLFTSLVAYLIIKINDQFERCIFKGDYYRLAYYIMPMYSCLIWIRGYFSFFYRATVWATILLFVLGELVMRRSVSKG